MQMKREKKDQRKQKWAQEVLHGQMGHWLVHFISPMVTPPIIWICVQPVTKIFNEPYNLTVYQLIQNMMNLKNYQATNCSVSPFHVN